MREVNGGYVEFVCVSLYFFSRNIQERLREYSATYLLFAVGAPIEGLVDGN